MNTRTLGNTGIVVSEIGFGAWQLGNARDWSPMSDDTAHRLVSAAVEMGVTLFDTAPHYADTHSERLLGEALSGKRDNVTIVSKFGHLPTGEKDFRVEAFTTSLADSLHRLQTDYLDVLLLHNPPHDVLAGKHAIWDALDNAKRRGEIHHFGVSVDLAEEVTTCLQYTDSTVCEVLFNILHQDVRKSFAKVNENGAGVIAKVPLDSGWLTGQFNNAHVFSGVRARWSTEQIATRADLVAQLQWLCDDGKSMTTKALAFPLSYPEVSCVIPGMRTLQQLRENVSASEESMSAAQRDRLQKFWDEVTSNGTRLLPW